jgi:hypothetical protein
MFLANDSTYGLSINAVNHLVAGLPLAIMGYPIKFLSSNTGGELARIDSSGNVGIGTTSPYAKLNVENGSILVGQNTNTTQTNTLISGYGYRIGAGLIGVASIKSSYNNGSNSASLEFYTDTGSASTERARIDTSGNLLVGLTATSAYMDGALDVQASGENPAICAKLNPSSSTKTQFVYSAWAPFTTGDNIFMQFETETSATVRGAISYNRAAGLVVYGTTSDYRSKDILGPVVDSGALIDSVPVYMGKMKGATQERPMFIAHETPAYAHTGEKDAVDAEGKPIYQQIDTSALLPVLWAEIQSLRQRVAALETSN